MFVRPWAGLEAFLCRRNSGGAQTLACGGSPPPQLELTHFTDREAEVGGAGCGTGVCRMSTFRLGLLPRRVPWLCQILVSMWAVPRGVHAQRCPQLVGTAPAPPAVFPCPCQSRLEISAPCGAGAAQGSLLVVLGTGSRRLNAGRPCARQEPSRLYHHSDPEPCFQRKVESAPSGEIPVSPTRKEQHSYLLLGLPSCCRQGLLSGAFYPFLPSSLDTTLQQAPNFSEALRLCQPAGAVRAVLEEATLHQAEAMPALQEPRQDL